MPELVIDLDELDLPECFKACYQRARDIVKRAIRLAAPRQVNINSSVYELHSPVACETVIDQGKTPVPLHVTGTLEELIEDGIYNIL